MPPASSEGATGARRCNSLPEPPLSIDDVGGVRGRNGHLAVDPRDMAEIRVFREALRRLNVL